ncbi:unnamed protein product [Symbiodinium sp. CCMP2456]|nr:unnamed protein product [Symbiodinium sp. CCMP2456]
MPQQPEAKLLKDLTEVPGGWPLATVIDAFLDLAAYWPNHPNASAATRAREAVSRRLADLWASQPAEAEAWLQRCRELYAKELAGKETRPEELCEALLRHGAAEWGKYECGFRFSEAGLLRGEPLPSAEREYWAAEYLQRPHTRDRCRELAERLVAAESQETARKRQKLEEETAKRRRLEAELQKSQEEGRDLRNRLVAVEAEVSGKDEELQAAQNESAKCKERCEELAARATGAEAAVAEMRQELGQLQEEHSQCQERCEELLTRLEAEAAVHATTKERLSQAASDAAERRVEVERLQEEGRGYQESCQQAEVARLASAPEPGSKAELQLEKEVLQDRCEQLRQQLTKAEADRSAMLGQLLDLREEKGMHKERIRELEKQLLQAKKSHHLISGHTPHCEAPVDEASNSQEPDLAERLGYSFVDDDGTASSVLSHSSWFSVKPDSVKPQCFMVDAIFKTRSFGADFFLMGRDLKKGSQVVAGDDASILEVAKTPEICDASEVVELQAGTATLRVTPDHLVQVADAKVKESLYLAAGKLKAGDLVMLDSGEVAALSSVMLRREACQVLKIVFEPYLPVAVFSRPTCILSLGHKKKPPIRRGGRSQGGPGPSDACMDGRASIPITAGEYMD